MKWSLKNRPMPRVLGPALHKQTGTICEAVCSQLTKSSSPPVLKSVLPLPSVAVRDRDDDWYYQRRREEDRGKEGETESIRLLPKWDVWAEEGETSALMKTLSFSALLRFLTCSRLLCPSGLVVMLLPLPHPPAPLMPQALSLYQHLEMRVPEHPS